MIVLAARRGVIFLPRERLVHPRPLPPAAWAHAFAGHAHPGREVEEKGVVYTILALPPGLDRVTRVVLAASLIPLVVVLAQKWRREGRLPHRDAAHRAPVQRLGVVDLLGRRSAGEVRGPGAALGAVPLLRVAPQGERGARARGPAVVRGVRPGAPGDPRGVGAGAGLGPLPRRPLGCSTTGSCRAAHRWSALGPTPYFAALYTFVNIHHYFMDYVLWRRENPLTRYLRAAAGAFRICALSPVQTPTPSQRRLQRRGVALRGAAAAVGVGAAHLNAREIRARPGSPRSTRRRRSCSRRAGRAIPADGHAGRAARGLAVVEAVAVVGEAQVGAGAALVGDGVAGGLRGDAGLVDAGVELHARVAREVDAAPHRGRRARSVQSIITVGDLCSAAGASSRAATAARARAHDAGRARRHDELDDPPLPRPDLEDQGPQPTAAMTPLRQEMAMKAPT